MAYFIRHDLDYGDLEFFKRLCLKIQDREGLSERYWLARRWLDAAVADLEAQRFQDTCGAVALMGKRLENYDAKPLKPVLAWDRP